MYFAAARTRSNPCAANASLVRILSQFTHRDHRAWVQLVQGPVHELNLHLSVIRVDASLHAIKDDALVQIGASACVEDSQIDLDQPGERWF